MRYHLLLTIATWVVLWSTTSCSKDEGFVVASDGDQEVPISFSINVGNLQNPGASTRGYTNGVAYNSGYTFKSGDMVTIGISGNGTSGRSTTEDVKQFLVTPSTGALTYIGSAIDDYFWCGTTETISLRAWNHGNASTPATDPVGNVFTIEANQKTGATADIKELLYSPATTYGYTTSSINVPLYHQLSRLIINLKSEKTVSSITLGNDDVPTSAIFGYTSGNYGTWSGHSALSTIIPKDETTTTGFDKTCSAVLIPGNQADYPNGALFLYIVTTDGGGDTNYAYAILLGEDGFEPGKQYTYDITIIQHLLSVTSVTITPWATDEWNVIAK